MYNANIYSANLPDQKVSTKSKSDIDFTKKTMDYYINEAIDKNYNDIEQIKQCFNIIDGDLDSFDIDYIVNPYKTEHNGSTAKKNYPTRFKNITIILPIINLFVGEFIKSQMPYTVYSTNSDVPKVFLNELSEATVKYLTQEFTNYMAKAGLTDQEEVKPQSSWNEFLENFKNNWVDKRTIIGQEAINFLTEKLKLNNAYLRGFIHWLLCDRFYTYKKVEYDTVVHEIIHPLEAYPVRNKNEFVEDYDAFVRIDNITYPQLIDTYRDYLDTKQMHDILKKIENGTGSSILTPFLGLNNVNDGESVRKILNENEGLNSYNIKRYHLTYKSPTKVGILTYMNMLGEIKQCDVSEDYKLDKENGDIEIKWEWINQVYEGYRFGEGEDAIYVPIRPILEQRDELNNKSICKLPYGGKEGIMQDLKFTNPVSLGIDFQLKYNIFHRKLELLINKSKDKIIVFPKGLIPDDDDFDMDKFIYFSTADGFMFYNEMAPNASNAVQGIKVLDAGLYEYIGKLYEVIQLIKQEYWDTIGMNPNRYGQVQASTGKGVNQDAINSSSTISVNLFDSYYIGIENDLQGLLDISKLAWINEDETKSIGAYITSDERVKYFSINGRKHLESDYGVFVGRYIRTLEKMSQLKQLAFSMSQNDKHELAAIAINSDNPVKLEQAIKAAIEAEREYENNVREQQSQQQQQIEQMISQREQSKNDVDIYKAELASRTQLEIAGLNSETAINTTREKLISQESINNSKQYQPNNNQDAERIGLEKEKLNSNNLNNLLELSIKKNIENDKNLVKLKEIETNLEIAKTNKNKYDSKKK